MEKMHNYEYAIIDKEYGRRVLGDAMGEMGPFTSLPYGSLATWGSFRIIFL